jgi:pyridoxal phosphate enzyme (YggS family)
MATYEGSAIPASTVAETLQERLAHVEAAIASACARSNRRRDDVTLIAVTKTVSSETAAILPGLGVRDLGESRPQELWKKAEAIPAVRWHFIGHLQRNKLERTLPLCHLLHSVDSDRLLGAVSDFGVQRGSPVPVLLEVNCSREEAKGGFPPEAVPQNFGDFPGVDIQGLMTMAAYESEPEACRATFRELRTIRDRLRETTGMPMPHLSMGMSNDYEVAIEEGATFIRLGSTLFENLA